MEQSGVLQMNEYALSQLLKRVQKRNPRVHELRAIIHSIAEFGFLEPVVYNLRTDTVLHGHGRLAALERLRKTNAPPPKGVRVAGREWFVPVAAVEVEPELEEIVSATLNRTAELGGWNSQLLEQILASASATRQTLLHALQWDISAVKESVAALSQANESLIEAQYEMASQPTMEEKKERYLQNEYYQIVLLYESERYKQAVEWLEEAKEEFGVETNTDAVYCLLQTRYGGGAHGGD